MNSLWRTALRACRSGVLVTSGLLAAAIGPLLLSAAEPGSEKRVDFNREIRPILSKSCFACHGPDAEHRKAGLRLDQRDVATRKLESDAVAITPGNLDSSEVYRRITSTEEAELMPPREAGPRLNAEQVSLISRWIRQGAKYSEHWSLVKPERHSFPVTRQKDWAKNGIDHFVLARLEHAGLAPSLPADRYVLIRRLSLDLRGLPPTPEEVRLFVNDASPNAYLRLVDRLLADPAFGERWARPWLDLARYADSRGYGSDPLREIWKYRDWVIDAFNRNLPYDQFTIEQLAGDLLPQPSIEQRVATAFHRNTLTNTEGGTDDEEYRVIAVKDRVDTTFQVWMGLTMGCAKCHNHKFDPITTAEYYSAFAVFNQTADNDQPDESPTLAVPTAEMKASAERIETELARLKQKLAADSPALSAEQERWEAELRGAVPWRILEVGETHSEGGVQFQRLLDGSLRSEGAFPEHDTYTVVLNTDATPISALRLEVLLDATFSLNGPGRGPEGEFILSHFSAALRKPDGTESPLLLSAAAADFAHRDYPVEQVLQPRDPPKKRGGWGVMEKSKRPHAAVFEIAAPLTPHAGEQIVLHLEQKSRRIQRLLGRFRISVTGAPQALLRQPVPADILSIIDKGTLSRSADQSQKVSQYFRGVAPSLKPVRDEIARLEKSRPRFPTVPVMQELAAQKHRRSHIHIKGNFLSPGEEVRPSLPSGMHSPPSGSPDRMALARWIVDPRNPLTARVAVNRFWSQLFGAGIVETEEDFGSQGELPSHPDLLDWLAVEFMTPANSADRAWDIQRLLKLIVSSATYQQSSLVSPVALQKDPRNRLYSRGPRFRLEAELVRDQALSLAGLLSKKMHGPSIFPPQPEGLWQAAFNGSDRSWVTSSGEDKYRRGIYVFWRRTIPYPSMTTFDAPSRETCSIRRIRTNTPLQAFVTLNDPVFVEAAQALARRIVREGGMTAEQRARFGLKLCLVRPPHDFEVQSVLKLLKTEEEHYRGHAREAKELIGALEFPANSSLPEMAGWTVVSNVLLNLDGVLSKN